MTTRIILIRHGQSTYNAQKRYQGCCDDAVLTEKGRLNAYQTGIELSHTAIDAIYVSPLRRTQETADQILSAIASVNDAYPQRFSHADLREIDLPAWQGLPFQQVRQQFAADYRCWLERPHEFTMPLPDPQTTLAGVSTRTKPHPSSQQIIAPVPALYQQARQFWQQVLPQHEGQTLAIVSHGGTIRALISTAMGIGCEQFHGLQQSNCGISQLEFASVQPNARARLVAVNQTAHLGESLPKLKNGKQGLRLVLVPIETAELALATLRSRLAPISFDFCLTSESAQLIAQNLLQHRSQVPIQLPIAHDHFLQTWHQTIRCESQSCADLCTGLVIVEARQMQVLLQQVLGLATTDDAQSVALGGLCVLYYPKFHPTPVIQLLASPF
jgi:phosphoserine phosphatase